MFWQSCIITRQIISYYSYKKGSDNDLKIFTRSKMVILDDNLDIQLCDKHLI